MAENKTSATKRRTDKIIRNSFITILSTKPIGKITVQDLCREADINRATFYRYYKDIYELMEAVSEDFFRTLFTDIAEKSKQQKNRNPKDAIRIYVADALDIIKEQKQLCKVLLINDADSTFTKHLMDSICEICMADMEQVTDYMHLQLIYMANGILSVNKEWLSEDCRTDKKTIAAVINQGINHTFDSIA